MRLALGIAVLGLAGCGPSLSLLGSASATRNADDTVRAEVIVECMPGWDDCPKQLCATVSWPLGGSSTTQGCDAEENVHTGHKYQLDIDSPGPIPRAPGEAAALKFTSGWDHALSVEIPTRVGPP